MRSRFAIVGLSAVLSLSEMAKAEQPDPPKARLPVEMAEDFLKGIQGGQIDAAFGALLAGSPLLEQGSSIEMLKSQTKAQLPLFGSVLGYEKLEVKETAASLFVLRYLVRQEKEAMTWAFVFYKPRDRWMVTALRWLPSMEYLR